MSVLKRMNFTTFGINRYDCVIISAKQSIGYFKGRYHPHILNEQSLNIKDVYSALNKGCFKYTFHPFIKSRYECIFSLYSSPETNPPACYRKHHSLLFPKAFRKPYSGCPTVCVGITPLSGSRLHIEFIRDYVRDLYAPIFV